MWCEIKWYWWNREDHVTRATLKAVIPSAAKISIWLQIVTRAHFRHVTPLGRPRSAYKSDIEYCFKWPNDLEGEGQWLLLSISAESIPGCMFGASLVILAQICDELSHGQAKFPRIMGQNGQNDLYGKCQWHLFSITTESIPFIQWKIRFHKSQLCNFPYPLFVTLQWYHRL